MKIPVHVLLLLVNLVASMVLFFHAMQPHVPAHWLLIITHNHKPLSCCILVLQPFGNGSSSYDGMYYWFADGKAEATVPILLGSGITESNIEDFFAADAVIVGSSFKHGNAWSGTLNGLQVQAFMEKIHMLRQTL